jgi:sec-independent protein translocase protein TatA
MFGIGMTEVLVILVVALIFFGPSRLPELARSLGRAMHEFRRASSDLRASFNEAIEPAPPPPVRPPGTPPAIAQPAPSGPIDQPAGEGAGPAASAPAGEPTPAREQAPAGDAASSESADRAPVPSANG